MNILLIPASLFVLVLLVGLLLLNYISRHRTEQAVRNRIRKEAISEGNELQQPAGKWTGRMIGVLSTFGNAVKPGTEAELSKSNLRFAKAGYRGKNAHIFFFGSKAVLGILFPAVFVILKILFFQMLSFQHVLTLMLFCAALGFYLPDLHLYDRTQARKKELFERLPDALDLMIICVEAGMGLDAAIKRVGEEMTRESAVLSDEFKVLSLELRAGKPRAEALRNLARRTDLEDISSLVTLLIQTDKFGTRVAQALRVNSDSMRTKRYQRAEEIAAKMPVKLIFPLIIFIFPALFVAIIGPAAITIFRNIISR